MVKDEIKKGSFALTLGTASFANVRLNLGPHLVIGDTSGSTAFKVNSPAGEYGILYQQSPSVGNPDPLGLIFYQAGVVVLNVSGVLTGAGAAYSTTFDAAGSSAALLLTGAYSQEESANAWRHRIKNISFNNTVELNSTVYFCRANHNEFNYSANKTYLSQSKIRVKDNVSDMPVSYITTVGMYSADNELLAVAKLSEPLKKDPTNEITLRVRLDY